MIRYEDETDKFIDTLKETDIYTNYVKQLEILEAYPDLKKGRDEFRERNFRLQNESDSETLFDEVDRLNREYEHFCSNPIVNNYLDAEVAFCRMFQKINEKILSTFASQLN